MTTILSTDPALKDAATRHATKTRFILMLRPGFYLKLDIYFRSNGKPNRGNYGRLKRMTTDFLFSEPSIHI